MSTPAISDVCGEAPSLVVIDRPDAAGQLLPLEQVVELATSVAEMGTLVVVDESYANYLGPRASAAQVTTELTNLVVIRSMSKGYCLGGLRVGYAVASNELAPDVRGVVPPLAVSQLPYRFALELLGAGDVFGRLRARVEEVHAEARDLLTTLGVVTVRCHPGLPWLLASDVHAATTSLTHHRIGYKRIGCWNGEGDGLVRVGIPLSPERLQTLRDLAA
jgi:histidinol-phosphate/aromatic aminotransferase/cobyric acid decarboxylase-like protein